MTMTTHTTQTGVELFVTYRNFARCKIALGNGSLNYCQLGQLLMNVNSCSPIAHSWSMSMSMFRIVTICAIFAEVYCADHTAKVTAPANHVMITSKFDAKTKSLQHTLKWTRLVGTSKKNNVALIGSGGSAGSCTRSRSQLVSTFHVPASSIATGIVEGWLTVKGTSVSGPLDVNLYGMKPVATIVDKEDISVLHEIASNTVTNMLSSDGEKAIATPFLSLERGAGPFSQRVNVTEYVRAQVATMGNKGPYQSPALFLPFRLRTATDLGCDSACDAACSIRRFSALAFSLEITQSFPSAEAASRSSYVRLINGHQLHYAADSLGNRLPDFSSVGCVFEQQILQV